MKKLFTNYNFEFNKNEKKLISAFCKQTLKQVEGDNRFFAEEKAFKSILEKLNAGSESIKLTKDERTRLVHQLEQNIKYLEKEKSKAWFLKKWLYNSMLRQYRSIYEEHFRN
jgi:septal ring factor EnvC (AmiA/AmiB activator)